MRKKLRNMKQAQLFLQNIRESEHFWYLRVVVFNNYLGQDLKYLHDFLAQCGISHLTMKISRWKAF